MTQTPNPTMVPKTQEWGRLLPKGNLRDLQAAYRVSKRPARALGERNPKTLPGVFPDSEKPGEARERNAHWERLRKLVQSGASDRVLSRAAR